jgi:anaerobic selenocysteine-containing dehydrogenase
MAEKRKTFCRVCHAACPMEVEVEGGTQVLSVAADRSDPLFGGFSCIKGRQLADQHHHPDRLRSSLRRTVAGFEPVASSVALDEIAARVAAITAEHGPRSVASYTGTGAFQNSTSVAVAAAWHAGIGSPSFYTSVTIDQPAHRAAGLRMGTWEAGWDNFTDADVSLAVGYNPLVSSYGPAGGLQGTDPFVKLREARARGLKLVVIDPRRTELAAAADVWLQVQPGEDPTLLAGIIRHILAGELHDAAFCRRWVDGLEALAAAVEPFTPQYVSRRAKVPVEDVAAAAELFAAGPRGAAGTGTGPNMAPHSMLTEHLTLALNVLCGRVRRAGETIESGAFLTPGDTRVARVVAPGDPTPGAAHRMGGLSGMPGEMLTNRLAEEILEPGEGQVRALICSGGNPVVAFPDQALTEQALASLELLVVIDPRMTPTAAMADYVIAPRLALERADVPHIMDSRIPGPYSNYTPAVLEVEHDLLSEWEVFAGIAARNGTEVVLPGGRIPHAGGLVDPSVDDDTILDLVYAKARMSMDEMRANRGVLHEGRLVRVVEAAPTDTARFDLAPGDVVEELAAVSAESSGAEVLGGFDADAFPFRLVSRRMKHVVNSLGTELPRLARVGTTNPAYMHPDDLAAMGVGDGDLVLIESPHGQVTGVAEAAGDVKPGVVSMSHSWGGASGDDDVRGRGVPTNRLVSAVDGFDPVTGMAVQSAIPVRVRPAPDSSGTPPDGSQAAAPQEGA